MKPSERKPKPKPKSIKTKITKIVFTKEQEELINKIKNREPIKRSKNCIRRIDGSEYQYTNNKPLSVISTKIKLRQIFGGICCICGQSPDYKVVYDFDGAQRIERYCETCFQKEPIADTYNKRHVKKKEKQ